jgi:serine/threonine-protein kinase
LKKLGRYELVRVLGKGAMGIVYEGRDPNLDRRVAIKTVKVENLSDEAAAEYEARFRTEARSAARLQHPNIVSVYDSDRDGDTAFLVMEYIQGDDLKHHLDKGVRYSLQQAFAIVRDLLSAVDYAHRQGIVHRDIKPANLLLEPDGRVKLTDFGVARMQDSGEATRTQGNMVGTLKYMSPEQVQGQKIDARADLFSVGVVLYQLLTDKRPFDGDNDFTIIHQIIGHTPPPPSSFNARLPAAVDGVVARALAKNREDRFATAGDFSNALQSALQLAEDATILPPVNPARARDGAAFTVPPGSGSIAGMTSGGTGSAVTQELELVYWKDVKESTDPDELRGFLARFPEGIYADLARRRLRRLATDPAHDDPDATRLPGEMTTLPLAQPPAPAVAPPPLPATATEAPKAPRAPKAARPADAAPAAAKSARHARSTSTAKAPPRDAKATRKLPMAVLAGIALLVLAGGGAALMASRKGAPDVAAAASPAAPLVAAPSASVAVAPAPVPVVAAAVPAPTPAPTPDNAAAAAASKPAASIAAAASAPAVRIGQAPLAAASAARKPQPESRARPKPSAVTAAAAPAPGAGEAAAQAAGAAAAQPVAQADDARNGGGRLASPSETCKDKMFIAKQYCLYTECNKPGFQNFPACVRLREEAKMRETNKYGN